MSYLVDLQPSGLFTLSTPVGRPLFDGAFRGDIPERMRVAELSVIAEAPAMFALLRGVLQETETAIQNLIAQGGGGALGQKHALDQAPGLFQMRDLLREQITRASGEAVPA